MPDVSLYQTLGVPKDATTDQVKRAYRRRAREAHPNTGGSEEAFAAVHLAWLVLSDDARRRRYDETGDAEACAPRPDNERSALAGLLAGAFAAVVGGMVQQVRCLSC